MGDRGLLTAFALMALLALVAWGAVAAGEPFWATLATRIAILALAGVGLNLALGYGGMVSLGHAAFFGIGGYVAGISADAAFNAIPAIAWPVEIAGTTSMPLIWLIAMAVSALVALAIGAISIRTEGVYFIMITLAFAQMIYYFAISWPAYGGEDGLSIYVRNAFPGLDTYDTLTLFWLAWGALLVCLVLTALIVAARFGQALECARQNPVRLATLGIEPYPVRLVAFAISGAITGLAGALYADLNGFVSPAMLGWHTSGELIVIVILGGVGRLGGPVAGAMVYVGLEQALRAVPDLTLGGTTIVVSQHWQLGLGLLLLAVVLFARGGLIGLIAGARRG